MNLTKTIEELRHERKQIDEAILSLERLAAGSGPRRGRPPGWLKPYKRGGRPSAGKEKAAPAAKSAGSV